MINMRKRTARIERKTAETDIKLRLDLDGSGRAQISTGIGFLDHLFTSLARHSRFDIELSCRGDLATDDHHTAEDTAICLGRAIDEALAERRGIRRFGSAYAPLDESLARAVVDLSGRPFSAVSLELGEGRIGSLSKENIPHVIRSLGTSCQATIHLDLLRGENDHHKAESAFKALALALRDAVARDGEDDVPSTKGVLV
jgi:imidazoleglycerol-phosphate dehydratase